MLRLTAFLVLMLAGLAVNAGEGLVWQPSGPPAGSPSSDSNSESAFPYLQYLPVQKERLHRCEPSEAAACPQELASFGMRGGCVFYAIWCAEPGVNVWDGTAPPHPGCVAK